MDVTSVVIQANYTGSDTGPFNLFSDVNGYTSAFEVGITKDQLLSGFVSYNVPVGTHTIRVVSTSPECTNSEEIDVDPVPTCPDRVLVFQVCNNNSQRDDNFAVKLNGNTIGALDLNSNAQVGSVFIASNDFLVITESDFPCPIGNMTVYRFDPSILSTNNIIEMNNIKNNGNGNQGDLEIRNYERVGAELRNPCVVQNFPWSGASGSNFEFNFSYTACCPFDTP